MTDFAALLIADDGSPATEVALVTAAGFETWLGQQGERTRALVAAQGFKGRADTLAMLSGDNPAEWSVVAGIDADPGVFTLAALAAGLPEGRYRLRFGDGMDRPVAPLGWLLAQHRFDRYRRGNGATGPRVLLTRDVGGISAAVRLAEATALAAGGSGMALSTFLPAAAIGNAVIAAAWSALGALGREELSLAMLVALVVPVALVWGVVRSRWSAVRPEPPPSA
jgi:hypothetical protein